MDDQYASFSNFAVQAADQNHTIAALASPHVTGTAALCIATGACTGAPSAVISKLRADAQTYNQATTTYGFNGDPARPVSGRFYGWLARAGGY